VSSDPVPYLTLAQWRRTVAESYAAIRGASCEDSPNACRAFREQRDLLFRLHAQSPLTERQRRDFRGLSYFPYDVSWRSTGVIRSRQPTSVQLGDADPPIALMHVADVEFTVRDHSASLAMYWIKAYGGGLFLPFRDGTNGGQTYGGGRYLYDTIKKADLGSNDDRINLDFNYAYNPSCAYNSQWTCPLPPPNNRLAFGVIAGERTFQDNTRPSKP